jgi:hypothetical protein
MHYLDEGAKDAPSRSASTDSRGLPDHCFAARAEWPQKTHPTPLSAGDRKGLVKKFRELAIVTELRAERSADVRKIIEKVSNGLTPLGGPEQRSTSDRTSTVFALSMQGQSRCTVFVSRGQHPANTSDS